ncbi:MAG: hypothetical protein RJB38_116 [Pseudomonadota bacterium]|jgi:alpha-beta hydrolase superfamily lysophospholipase
MKKVSLPIVLLAALSSILSTMSMADSLAASSESVCGWESRALDRSGTWTSPSEDFDIVNGTFCSKASSRKSARSLFYRARVPKAGTTDHPKEILIIVHGLKDHSGRYDRLIHALDTASRNDGSFEVWAYDQPHHGRSGLMEVGSGKKPTGNVDTIDENVKHLRNFVRLVSAERPGRPLILFGHSMGGLVVASYLQKLPEDSAVSGAVLSAPALKTFDSFSNDLQEVLIGWIGRHVPSETPAVPDFLKNKYFFRDPSLSAKQVTLEIERLKNDSLVHHGLHTIPTAQALINGIEKFRSAQPSVYSIPVMIVHAFGDRITNPKGSYDFFLNINASGPSRKNEFHLLKDHSFHDLPGQYAEKFAEMISQWIGKIR